MLTQQTPTRPFHTNRSVGPALTRLLAIFSILTFLSHTGRQVISLCATDKQKVANHYSKGSLHAVSCIFIFYSITITWLISHSSQIHHSVITSISSSAGGVDGVWIDPPLSHRTYSTASYHQVPIFQLSLFPRIEVLRYI
jgi:hypothetical protein